MYSNEIKEMKNEIKDMKNQVQEMSQNITNIKELIPMLFSELNRIKYKLKLK